MALDSYGTLGETIGEAQRNLDDILERHRQWLDSGGLTGERANLSGKNLRNLSFREADLQRAVLGNAQIYDADFYGASLREVDLQQVEGLTEGQLAGTDLSHARLPQGIGNFVSLDQINDISVQARTLLWVTIGTVVFAFVTTFVTDDAVILAHSGSTLLPPVAQINVPIDKFFWCMPLVLLGLYLYLHFQLQYLWNGLSNLPSFFPDASSLDERAYPLFLRSLVRLHVPLLKKHRPSQWRLQAYTSIAVAWGLVPFTIFIFWLRYLRIHEPAASLWHLLLLVLASMLGFLTYRLAAETLGRKGSPRECVVGQSDKRSKQPLHILRKVFLVILFLFLMLCCLVSGAAFCIEGQTISSWPLSKCPYCESLGSCFRWLLGITLDTPQSSAEMQSTSINEADTSDESILCQLIRPYLCADFSFGEISHKPDNWLNLKEEERMNFLGVKGAVLTNVNLQGAHGHAAFLAKATLKGADLQGANLEEADLSQSYLVGAQMNRAHLGMANLSGSNLDKVHLEDADLRSAVLQRATLSHATLSSAKLYRAKLQEADFQGANLSRADLGRANLARAKLKAACLCDADFTEAWFHDTQLQGADLLHATGLTDKQIGGACGDEHTKLPSHIHIQLKQCEREDGDDQEQPACRPCR